MSSNSHQPPWLTKQGHREKSYNITLWCNVNTRKTLCKPPLRSRNCYRVLEACDRFILFSHLSYWLFGGAACFDLATASYFLWNVKKEHTTVQSEREYFEKLFFLFLYNTESFEWHLINYLSCILRGSISPYNQWMSTCMVFVLAIFWLEDAMTDPPLCPPTYPVIGQQSLCSCLSMQKTTRTASRSPLGNEVYILQEQCSRFFKSTTVPMRTARGGSTKFFEWLKTKFIDMVRRILLCTCTYKKWLREREYLVSFNAYCCQKCLFVGK